ARIVKIQGALEAGNDSTLFLVCFLLGQQNRMPWYAQANFYQSVAIRQCHIWVQIDKFLLARVSV
ncbi:uncharacterized protein METZ01_LOCUS248338, partial [marine metagenome]